MLKKRTAFVALAICLALIADSSGQSHRPSPRSRESIQPPISKAANPPQPTASDQRGTDQSPVVVKVLPSDDEKQKTATEAKREEQKATNDERLTRFTEYLFCATVALSFIAMLQLFAFCWQGIQLKRTVDLGNREFISTHRPMVVIRQISIWNRTAHQNLMKGEPFQFADGEKIDGHFDLVNTGETRATIEFYCTLLHWQAGPLPMVNPIDRLRVDRQEPPIIREGGSHLTMSGLTGGPISQEDIGNIITGSKTLYVLGWVRYRDDRNVTRETRFCRMWNNSERRFSAINNPDYEYSD